MRLLLPLILVAVSGAATAQTGPATGTSMRDGSQPTGSVLQPERRLQPELQPPPQNPQPFGASSGSSLGSGPIQETGNYGNLGQGAPASGQPGMNQRSLVQPDYQRRNDDAPFQKR